MANKTTKGRKPMFKKEFGKTKRISVPIPSKLEAEIRVKINKITKPYLY